MNTEALFPEVKRPRHESGYLTTHHQPVPRLKIRVTIGCSFCRFIRRPEHLIGRHYGISWQTEGHSFGPHLNSESVLVMPSSVIETSIVLCSLSSWLVWVNVQSACALNTRYISTWCLIYHRLPPPRLKVYLNSAEELESCHKYVKLSLCLIKRVGKTRLIFTYNKPSLCNTVFLLLQYHYLTTCFGPIWPSSGAFY
jgi:hypothetical protein